MVAFGSLSIAQCENFEMTITSNNPTCYYYSDGSVTISATGGNGGNDYAITNSAGTTVSWVPGEANDLIWGWYYCQVIDDLGCELYDSVYLENPGELQPIVYYTDPSSLTACDGIATVDTVLNHQGGYNGISYYWNPGGPDGIGQNIKSDLCNEYFTLIVNDSIGCWVEAELSMGSANINAIERKNSFSVFPNPFTESTIIQVDPIHFGETLFIYNQLGQVIWSEVIDSELTTITRGDLTTGVYIFIISDVKGKLIVE